MQPAEHKPKAGTAIKKSTSKKPNRANVPNAPKRVPANPRGANRNLQPSQTRVGDLLNMKVSVSSKRDAQAAMKIAKQLEAEAKKFLGPIASDQRQQQQQNRRSNQTASCTTEAGASASHAAAPSSLLCRTSLTMA